MAGNQQSFFFLKACKAQPMRCGYQTTLWVFFVSLKTISEISEMFVDIGQL